MSMNTKDYKTKTMVVERDFPCRDNYWAVGLDIGYSAVKGISPAHYFCFPAYAKKIPENRPLLKEAADTDIRYRDNEGEWVVGNLAYEEMDASKMTESEEEVFGRKRYYSPMFKVIVRTGLGIALMEGKEKSSDGKKLYVQTGLPPKFMRDSEDLKEVFKGIHMFELKIGTAPWQTFTFSLDEQNISIMPQPLGALLSASTDINGYQLPMSFTLDLAQETDATISSFLFSIHPSARDNAIKNILRFYFQKPYIAPYLAQYTYSVQSSERKERNITVAEKYFRPDALSNASADAQVRPARQISALEKTLNLSSESKSAATPTPAPPKPEPVVETAIFSAPAEKAEPENIPALSKETVNPLNSSTQATSETPSGSSSEDDSDGFDIFGAISGLIV